MKRLSQIVRGSRFLKKRHYKLIITGVRWMEMMHKHTEVDKSITCLICNFMDETGVSYTEQDIAEIQTAYLCKYGQRGKS